MQSTLPPMPAKARAQQRCEAETKSPSAWRHDSGVSISPRTSRGGAEPQPICKVGTVRRGGAQEQLRRLRSPVQEMGIVLPREADSTVNLDIFGRRVVGGVRAHQLGDRHRQRSILGTTIEGICSVLHSDAGGLDFKIDVSALVFDRLETSYRAAELFPHLRVGDRRVKR